MPENQKEKEKEGEAVIIIVFWPSRERRDENRFAGRKRKTVDTKAEPCS